MLTCSDSPAFAEFGDSVWREAAGGQSGPVAANVQHPPRQGDGRDIECRRRCDLCVVRLSDRQQLMRYICKNGFEHHAAMSASHCAQVFQEALETYLRWDVYHP